MGKNENRKSAQDFINIEDIQNDVLISKDGHVFGYLYVRGRSPSLMTENEQANYFDSLTTAMENIKETWQLLSIPRTMNVTAMLEHLFQLRKKAEDDITLRLIGGEIAAVNELALLGAREPVIVLKIWEKASPQALPLLQKRLRTIQSLLGEQGVVAEILTNQEIVFICKMFSDLTVHSHIEESPVEDIPVLKGKKKIDPVQESLLDLIAPMGGFSFGANKVTVGNVYGRVYGAVRYPSELSYGWLTAIMNTTAAITSITFNPSLSGDLAEALSKSIQRNVVEASGERDARLRRKYVKQAEDADELIGELDEKNSIVGFSTILVMPFSSREEDFDEVAREVQRKFSSKRIRLRALGNVQKQAFEALSPYYTNRPLIDDMLRHIMPLGTLMGGAPMTINSYRDALGYYFGQTEDGSVVSLDLLYRGYDRTNSNITVMGKPGMGKSTALKHIIQTQFMRGTKILVIDPEREFSQLCNSLGGSIVPAGGSNKSRINPLEVRLPPRDDEEDSKTLYDTGVVSPLALHLKTLEVFFDLYLPSLTALNKALLQRALVELYSQFGIAWDTEIQGIQSFPVFFDLYTLLSQKGEDFKELAALLYSAAEGADSFIFNGQTSVNWSSRFVCFDTSNLVNSSDAIKRTQYFNVLALCWEIMSADKAQPVLLVCDEAYLLIDPAIPQSMLYLRNISKRCRKYEGSLAVASHSVVDFLDERIKMYAQSLLDAPTYKIIFGTDGKNLKETAALYDLTEAEQDILLAAKRSHALFMMGNTRFKINFILPDYKLALMGTAGGR